MYFEVHGYSHGCYSVYSVKPIRGQTIHWSISQPVSQQVFRTIGPGNSRQASHMALWFLFLECDCCSYSACSMLGKFVSLFPCLTTHG